MTKILECRDLRKSYDTTEILHGIDLAVEQGEILAIMGTSGCGKSTLIHSLAAIISINEGEVYFKDQRIDNLSDKQRAILRRTEFGFVFQFSQLVPELTALDNVALPLLLNGVAKKKAYSQAQEWLAKVGLQELQNSVSGELSGGEAQRVAVARAMVTKPAVLFADEPTGSLDSLASQNIMELFTQVNRETGTSIVMVTHDPLIAAYAHREIIVRDGQIVEEEY